MASVASPKPDSRCSLLYFDDMKPLKSRGVNHEAERIKLLPLWTNGTVCVWLLFIMWSDRIFVTLHEWVRDGWNGRLVKAYRFRDLLECLWFGVIAIFSAFELSNAAKKPFGPFFFFFCKLEAYKLFQRHLNGGPPFDWWPICLLLMLVLQHGHPSQSMGHLFGLEHPKHRFGQNNLSPN